MPVITLADPNRPKTDHYQSAKGNTIDVSHAKIKRFIPLEEVKVNPHYTDLAKLAKIFNHDVVEMDSGTWRWRPNLLIDWLYDHAGVFTPSAAENAADGGSGFSRGPDGRASLNLNVLVCDLHAGMFTMEEWMKFYMQKGYSLDGYYEVFGQSEAADVGLPGAKKPKSRDAYTETVIDYMIRVHKGKVLKL